MATKKYEIKSPIRLEDGELVSGGVRSFDPEAEDTRTFVGRGVIALVPGQEDDGIGGRAATSNAPVQDPNNTSNSGPTAPPVGGGATDTTDGGLSEAVGADIAQTLAENGYATLDQAAAATDEDLLAIDGVGKKTVENVRAASGS